MDQGCDSLLSTVRRDPQSANIPASATGGAEPEHDVAPDILRGLTTRTDPHVHHVLLGHSVGVVSALLLDIGGVLELTPATRWVEKWEDRLRLESGGLAPVVSPIWRPGRTGEASLADIEERTAQALRLDTESSRELWQDVWAWYVGTLNADLVEYLSSLRRRYRLAILSNSFVGAREREEALYSFSALFDPIVYSHEEGLEKPDPAFYRLACDRIGAEPSEVVFVDDTEGHVTVAQAVGMRGVIFRDNATAIADIKGYLDQDATSG